MPGLWAGLKPVSYTHLDVYKRQDVLRHRIGLTYEAEAENVNVIDVILSLIHI